MKIIVTGGAGFLGQRVAASILKKSSLLKCETMVLVDVVLPKPPPGYEKDLRVQCLALDLTANGVTDRLIDSKTDVLFHLAAIVSGHAELDFDLGLRVNFDVARQLLETARRVAPSLKMVFTSTCGVFGGNLPAVLDDMTAVTPQNSYGMAKGMSELLMNDYARRSYVDARIVRLPTVSVRAGTANKAVTSFASGIIREPLNGEEAECPVPLEQEIWLTSPGTVVHNIIYAATLPPNSLGPWRVVNLPGITLTVKQMVEALRTVAGEKAVSLIKFTNDKKISEMVASFPARFDNTRALSLGFAIDKSYEDVIRAYIRDDLNK